ncbi:MAG: ethanolamine ammonia-lyase subunit EutC [Verrucomicrobia bacterium]|nr:ethanolamine ammonia-lyase subunit EutC [Verrucomicrobiota bacterium]
MSLEPTLPDAWAHLRRHTAARIALGRTGGSVPTGAQLAFALDHALARDAVHAPFDAGALADTLSSLHPDPLVLHSAAPDRATYLQRPDLGRRLSDESAARISALTLALPPDLVVLVSDGLSALAAQRQAAPLLGALLPHLRAAGFVLAPLCVVHHARVALMDEVGALLRARLALMLLGERPGLGTPDSLGAYLVFGPAASRTNADRNCVSNIRPAGLAPELAAEKLFALLTAASTLKLSGIALKEPALAIAATARADPALFPASK